MPRPVQELLHPACPEKPAWALFDPGWYLHHYADARALCAGRGGEAPLAYYLRVGARLGHSPSAIFDEAWYLDVNPDVAELVRAGRYACGFDHYCQHGWRGVSPHWLFDDALYAELYDDMSLENLQLHGCFGRYDHYLRAGQKERRIGHYLFDGPFYRAAALRQGAAEGPIDGAGPYTHYLNQLGSGADEPAPSLYFDPAWYVEHHPSAKAEILRGRYLGALHHYLTNKAPEGFDPVPQFSERFYRARYPDIEKAIETGMYRNAYQQFIQYGCFELRQPSAEIDLAYYRDMHDEVRAAINLGVVRDAFAHLRGGGLQAGLSYSPPLRTPTLDEFSTREAFIREARAALPLFARQQLDFSYAGEPSVSVLVALHNRFELTMRALASLRRNFAGAIQLILVDNGSSDETRRIGTYVRGAVVLRNEENEGFLRACNQGLARAEAPALLYMNNDVELDFGAVAASLARLASDAAIGGVCGKVVRTHGRLQETGAIAWAEGTTTGYLRDAAPLAAEANFLRQVDFGSAVFLLCRTAAVRALGGFDEAFAPAYYEDADLCLRLGAAGYRIMYDPSVSLTHLEFGSAATSEASMALMRRGRRLFRQKHATFLATRPRFDERHALNFRALGGRKRILFIEDTIPLRRLGSGFVRSNDIAHALAAAGHELHVFPMNGAPYDIMSLLGDLPEGAEILYDRDSMQLAAFLGERVSLYDLIWVSRTHNLRRIAPLLKLAGVKAKLVLDTEALASAREASRAALDGSLFDLKTAVKAEFADLPKVALTLAVNETEATLLRGLGRRNVAVLGTARAPSPTPADFAARAGLLFVGAIHQQNAPNDESLHYFANRIAPLLPPELLPLTFAGHVATGLARDWGPSVRHLGEIADTTPLYNAARLFIAPTRLAAGTPYKLYEAAAMGLPIVATTLLATQLGWQDGEELLAVPENDPAAFAHAITRLHQNQTLWHHLRQHALTRLHQDNNPTTFQAHLQRLIAPLL